MLKWKGTESYVGFSNWNSIVAMIERYLLLKACIKKALIDLNSQINVNENEIEMMQELLNILK